MGAENGVKMVELLKMVKLRSSDDNVFEVEEAVAKMSKTISHIINDGCADDTITLPNVDSQTLTKIIEYCKKHVAYHHDGAVNEESESSDQQMIMANWDADFVRVLDKAWLFNLLQAVHYLDIKDLFDLICQTIADMIKVMKVEEVREFFGIENNFTPEEEEAVRNEHRWAYE